MKITIFFLAAVAFTSAFGLTHAVAQSPESSKKGRPGGPGGPDITGIMKILPLMVALDEDGDGALSSAEINNATAALKKLDKNADDTISRDELRPSLRDLANLRGPGGGGLESLRDKAGPMGLQMLGRLFDERDTNRDGKLTGDEVPERVQPILERVDTNGDGALEKSELDAAAAKFSGQFSKGKKNEQQGGSGVKPKRPE